ncbi:MAG: hypothetical protein MZV63_14105 [Marinilabiliales bacterium]|nr:hypothetical protein [Marinilabiliales bacterium]
MLNVDDVAGAPGLPLPPIAVVRVLALDAAHPAQGSNQLHHVPGEACARRAEPDAPPGLHPAIRVEEAAATPSARHDRPADTWAG